VHVVPSVPGVELKDVVDAHGAVLRMHARARKRALVERAQERDPPLMQRFEQHQ